MSKTFRRKNYEQQTPRPRGYKTAGYYTQYDKFHECLNGHEGHWSFRAPTKLEHAAEYWRIHGESKHTNAWGPGSFYKRCSNRMTRRINGRELKRCLSQEYEPFFVEKEKFRWDLKYW